ncbi:MAG: hypothetical protein U0324_33740 [Polyangiales bacterium]
MDRTRPPLNPWHGLAHPAWWAALGLLALNDHVLKGRGLLPGALTGKLSDVAGLVVAPVLAAALLGARGRRGVAAAFALVAAGFAAIKVSPAASGAYVGALAALGMRARNAVDPTDLAALAVLPLAWRLCAERPVAALRAGRQRLAVALGGLACVATSQPDPGVPGEGEWVTSAFVANATSDTIEVRLRWVEGDVSCRDPNERAAGVFLRGAFGSEPLTVRLAPGRTFPLSRDAALRAIASGDAGAFAPGVGRCGAVLVQADNLASAVVWLPPFAQTVPPRWSSNAADPAPGLVLQGDATELTARGVGDVASAPPAEEPAVCAGSITRYFVADDVTAWNSRRVERVGVQADGCTRLEAADGIAMTVCVPEEAVPFRAGDTVTATFFEGVWTLQADRGVTLTVAASSPAARVLGAHGLRVLVPTCSAHSACGAYAERRELAAPDAPAMIAHDQRVDLRGARLYFGGGERPLVRPSACGTAALWQSPGGNDSALPALYNLAVVTGL